MKRLFYKTNSVSILLIGAMVENTALINLAKEKCKSVHASTNVQEMLEIVLNNPIHLIFGTPSHEENFYLEALSCIKEVRPQTALILFLQPQDIAFVNQALILKCKRYFCFLAEEEHATTHLEEAIIDISDKDIFLNDSQYFDALLHASVVSQSDTKGKITYINDNFTKVTGYTEAEAIGHNYRILRHPDMSVEVYQDMWQTIMQGKVWRDRVLNRNKDGSDFWADTIIIPFKDHTTGKIIQYIAVQRDITQIIEEHRVAQEKERKANEQVKLSEAKDSFLILFTHELKTPLNAIINFSQYLYKNMYRIEEIPLAKRLHLLDQIYKSASSMLENVTNILDLSRLRDRKINFTYTLFDINESLSDVLEKHEALALEFKKEVLFHHDGEALFISSDEFRFKQIIANILSNAIKYGQTVVEVFLLYTQEKIEIIIEDDGLGIEDKQSVFELYQQSHKGLNSMEKKGTGIGLNFVKLLCEELDFQYRIEDSTALGGTKFILTKVIKEHKNV